MHDLLPKGANGTYEGEFTEEDPKSGELLNQSVRTKPGELYTRKLKVVCDRCNNEWMSRIEEAIIPTLTSIIQGKRVTLDAAELKSLSHWATLKSIVLEHGNGSKDHVTPLKDRMAFAFEGTIPSYFSIYFLSHASASEIGYVRTSHAISLTSGPPTPPLEDRVKNVQQISVMLGRAMLHVNAAYVDGFRIEDRLDMPKVIERRIWPPNQIPLSWPAEPFLTTNQMRDLAYAMERVTALPQVKRGGDLLNSPQPESRR